MIKFTILLRRKPEITHQEFLEHHRRHAELFATLSESVRNNIRSYTLSHTVGAQIPGLPESSFDGVVEFRFDNTSGLMALLTSEEYQATIRPDEERFLDSARCEFFLGKETVVIP